MLYRTSLSSPVGVLTLYSDGTSITAITMLVWRHQPQETGMESPDLPVFQTAKRWLENYFTGIVPEEFPPLFPAGTPFQKQIWQILQSIPQGSAVTYGEIARRLEELTGKRTSPRAVGNAVGRNPIAILIPCHRVLGADHRLTGFGGGLEAKRFLLELEGIPYRD